MRFKLKLKIIVILHFKKKKNTKEKITNIGKNKRKANRKINIHIPIIESIGITISPKLNFPH